MLSWALLRSAKVQATTDRSVLRFETQMPVPEPRILLAASQLSGVADIVALVEMGKHA